MCLYATSLLNRIRFTLFKFFNCAKCLLLQPHFLQLMKQIIQLSVILLFWVTGEVIVKLAGLAIPGSIIGMLLLVVSLKIKLIKPKQVEETAHFLIDNMALFFIPAGVGLMCYFDIIQQDWLPIVISITISTILVMAVIGILSNTNKPDHE